MYHCESHIPPLQQHNPLFLMKRSMRLFYCCCPVYKTPITSALAERAAAPRGDLRDLYWILIQFTSGWDGMFTRACKTLRGAHIHLPISPIPLTLAQRITGWRVRKRALRLRRWCRMTSVTHHWGAFYLPRLHKIPSPWFKTEVVLKLIPGVFLLFRQWEVKHLSQRLLSFWYWEDSFKR